MKHLVVGCGEVGKALMEVLCCDGHDPAAGFSADPGQVDMLHICIPYSESFDDAVRAAQHRFSPLFTIIHSTVPIGTSDRLVAHHSPIRGRHPHLARSIRTFQKYVGGPDAVSIANELCTWGIPAIACRSARDAEAGKLIDLMQLGQAVLLEKAIHEFCEKNQLDYGLVYRQFNQSYNRGYAEMDAPHFQRPLLEHVDGPIGGHCVVQNMKWLDMPQAKEIISANSALTVPAVHSAK